MMKRKMKQTVLIGLGGTGSRVVNNVARELRERNIGINDGIVTCAVLDTNQTDNELIKDSGTEIPVIATCDERTIDEYLANYAHKDPRSWCPYSRSLGTQTMIDGASEMRVKSRVAFMDTMATSTIYDLQAAIEKVFHNRPGTPEKIRVLIVSSLVGGTGSGMFIQVALWMRKFFQERSCIATIRGILLLPDIFLRTLDNIRNNPMKKLSLYANAYAAIREINAINKIIKTGEKPERPIIISDLFDSNNPPSHPIFDNAFFIDDVDANGAAFDSQQAYEKMVAQIVYMQLYAPMHKEMISVEDNLYKAFERSKDPIYGSCGTSKAVYPIDDVIKYCALRATDDSISQGWSIIDEEIKAMEEEEKNAEKDGASSSKRINKRDMFIKLFDEKSQKKSEEVGISDKLFVSIKKDIFDETRISTGKGDETAEVLSCKISSFMNLIEEEIKKSVTENGGCKKISNIGTSLPDPEKPDNFSDNLKEQLKSIRDKEKDTVSKVLNDFDKNVSEYADSIIRSLVPLNMGSVNKDDKKSLFGIFQKTDANNNVFFVHPVAARYLLYKLSQEIEVRQNKLVVDQRRKDAENGATKTVSFDNPKTRIKETLDDYWSQVGWFVSKTEIQHFLRKYKTFNTENTNLCTQYETSYLTQLVLKALQKRVKDLIVTMENLFNDFPKLREELNKQIEANIDKNANDLEKTLFVYANREHKECMYKSLGIDVNSRQDKLHKDVIETVYGKFCAIYRPNANENKVYVQKSVIKSFYITVLDNYIELIKNQYEEDINLDIISAICAESDFTYKEEQGKLKPKDKEIDLFSDETEETKANTRYKEAILAYRNKLSHMAVPFLQAKADAALAVKNDIDGLTIDENNEIWMTTEDGERLLIPIQTHLTFWGFNPLASKKFPAISSALGANKATTESDGYGVNELYCYSSIYGVKAEAITKFNELSGGDYYKNYSAVINTMIKNGTEVDTPHIDKTWHEFLPYVSPSMQEHYSQKFYRTFWRAIAYGRISLDDKGRYQISQKAKDVFGNITYNQTLLLEKGNYIPASEVLRLINALKTEPEFCITMARELEDDFEDDVRGMVTYVGTDIIQGLLVQGDSNPFTMIVRYAMAKDSISSVKDNLMGALKSILYDVASHYDKNRGEEEINVARIKLSHRIYKESRMTKKNKVFDSWIKEFKSLKLPIDGEDEGADDTTDFEDII